MVTPDFAQVLGFAICYMFPSWWSWIRTVQDFLWRTWCWLPVNLTISPVYYYYFLLDLKRLYGSPLCDLKSRTTTGPYNLSISRWTLSVCGRLRWLQIPQRTPPSGHSGHRNVTFQPATVRKVAVCTAELDFIKEGFVLGGSGALTAVVARAGGQRSPARTLKTPRPLPPTYTVSLEALTGGRMKGCWATGNGALQVWELCLPLSGRPDLWGQRRTFSMNTAFFFGLFFLFLWLKLTCQRRLHVIDETVESIRPSECKQNVQTCISHRKKKEVSFPSIVEFYTVRRSAS